MARYVDNYIHAIENPLPLIKKAFDEELNLLRQNSTSSSKVLDVGCGAGRPADTFSNYVKSITGIDNDDSMLQHARSRCANMFNVNFINDDAANMSFSDGSFDLVFATYNLIGSLPKNKRQKLVDEMTRASGEKVVNFTWKDDEGTTEFLKEYYANIGINIYEINQKRTITSVGTFDRVSIDSLVELHEKSGLSNLVIQDVGPIWVAITGDK